MSSSRFFSLEMSSAIPFLVAPIISIHTFACSPELFDSMFTKNPGHFSIISPAPGSSVIRGAIPDSAYVVKVEGIVKKEVIGDADGDIDSESFIINHMWGHLQLNRRGFSDHRGRSRRSLPNMNIKINLGVCRRREESQAEQAYKKNKLYHNLVSLQLELMKSLN
jgi:hypothetical protein